MQSLQSVFSFSLHPVPNQTENAKKCNMFTVYFDATKWDELHGYLVELNFQKTSSDLRYRRHLWRRRKKKKRRAFVVLVEPLSTPPESSEHLCTTDE